MGAATSVSGAGNTQSHIICRPEMADSQRHKIARDLRDITNWPELHFDDQGVLSIGASQLHEASPMSSWSAAQKLLLKAATEARLIVLEDASHRDDVVFSRVVDGLWRQHEEAKHRLPVSIILIDFADFSHVTGDRAALRAFNIGWAVLHEMAHVIHGAPDTAISNEVGECEALINVMRRECGLAERAEYFFAFYPGQERSEFKTRLVRLAFVSQIGAKKAIRHWLMWDARVVGGLDNHRNAVTGYKPH